MRSLRVLHRRKRPARHVVGDDPPAHRRHVVDAHAREHPASAGAFGQLGERRQRVELGFARALRVGHQHHRASHRTSARNPDERVVFGANASRAATPLGPPASRLMATSSPPRTRSGAGMPSADQRSRTSSKPPASIDSGKRKGRSSASGAPQAKGWTETGCGTSAGDALAAAAQSRTRTATRNDRTGRATPARAPSPRRPRFALPRSPPRSPSPPRAAGARWRARRRFRPRRPRRSTASSKMRFAPATSRAPSSSSPRRSARSTARRTARGRTSRASCATTPRRSTSSPR